MKNLFVFASILLVSSIVMVSCSKDEAISKTETLESSLLEVDLNEVSSKFTNEYAYFESNEELRAFYIQFVNSDEARKETLLNKLNYQTLDEKLDVIYEGMITIETREAFVDYVSNYSDLIEIAMIGDEEEVIEKEISKHAIAPFLNTDRIIKVGDEFRKFIGEYYVASSNYDDLAMIHRGKDIYKSELNYEKVLSIESGFPQKKTSYFFAELGNNQRRCKNKRKVQLIADLTVNATNDQYAGVVYDVFPYIEAVAKRKGIPCIWYRYKTHLEWDNFHFEYIIDGRPKVTWLENDIKLYTKEIIRTNGDNFLGSYSPICEWKKIRSTIGSRGLGTKVMDIDNVY